MAEDSRSPQYGEQEPCLSLEDCHDWQQWVTDSKTANISLHFLTEPWSRGCFKTVYVFGVVEDWIIWPDKSTICTGTSSNCSLFHKPLKVADCQTTVKCIAASEGCTSAPRPPWRLVSLITLIFQTGQTRKEVWQYIYNNQPGMLVYSGCHCAWVVNNFGQTFLYIVCLSTSNC